MNTLQTEALPQEIQFYLGSVEESAAGLCRAMSDELLRLGFRPGQIAIADHKDADYRLEHDPALGTDSLIGQWNNAQRQKCGEILFHADGSFYAEYDVIHLHPNNDRWFVVSVSAWGKGETIKAEATLLPVAG